MTEAFRLDGEGPRITNGRHLHAVPDYEETNHNGYQPRPSDEEIDEIVAEYMGFSPDDLAISGLSKNLQEVMARVQLKAIKESPDNTDSLQTDFVLWTEYYAHLYDPEDEDQKSHI